MRKSIYILFLFVALIGCGPSYDQTVEIESLGNQMKYNVPQITAAAGSSMLIKFRNNANMEIMKHNIVILSDKKFIDEVGKAALSAENYLPDHEAIIAASELIGPGELTELELQVPAQPGEYPYICTFPGHYQVMQGIIVVK
ncbi:MAG: plastocyanin/azurin family copper-binding protein [Candidatus Marinamargulisbacteria bacterium]